MFGFENIIELANDIVQMIFWCVAGVLGILTYRQAKKTIFQPAKNEVFKTQIKELGILIQALNWKSSHEAWSNSGLESSYDINLNKLFKSFAKDFYGAEVSSKSSEMASSVGCIISQNAELTLIVGPADDPQNEETSAPEKMPWETYVWDFFEISSTFQENTELLNDAINNPVLPFEVIDAISAVQKELQNSLIRSAEDLEKAVREFPRHYPSKNSLNGADLTWARNMGVERGEKLFDSLNNLKRVIREYLKTDQLFGL